MMDHKMEDSHLESHARSATVYDSAHESTSVPMKMEEDTTTPLRTAEQWNASVEQPACTYTPQFSAATSLILSRIRRGEQNFGSALEDASATALRPSRHVYEDARARLLQNITTSSSAQPNEATRPVLAQGLASSDQEGPGRFLRRDGSGESSGGGGTKRKRQEPDSDFTQNTIAMPSSSPSPANFQRQSHAPSAGSSEPLEAESVNDAPPTGHPTFGDDSLRQQKIERIRQKRLAALPEGVVPAKPELVGFGPGTASSHTVSVVSHCCKNAFFFLGG